MRRNLVLAACCACSCKAQPIPQAEQALPFPRQGIYSEVVTDPKGWQASRVEYLNLADRDRFEKFIVKLAGRRCKPPPPSIAAGTFVLEVRCDTPEQDIRSIPMRHLERAGTHAYPRNDGVRAQAVRALCL